MQNIKHARKDTQISFHAIYSSHTFNRIPWSYKRRIAVKRLLIAIFN